MAASYATGRGQWGFGGNTSGSSAAAGGSSFATGGPAGGMGDHKKKPVN